jgi:hypothetical protein
MVARIGRELSHKLGSVAASRRLARALTQPPRRRRPRVSIYTRSAALTQPPRWRGFLAKDKKRDHDRLGLLVAIPASV